MITYLRKVAAIALLVPSLLAGSFQNTAESKEDSASLQLYAQSAVLMDADSGRILYEKNGQEKKPMASTTKIMTCILALENGNLEDYAAVSSYAAGMPKVKLGMQQGEYFKLEDLLYSLMLESHNDSAVAIAEHIGGSVEGFANMMNQKARDIGCYDTFFITPNGLDATAKTEDGEVMTHSTTAADLARIMSYCICDSPKKEEFLKITRTADYQFSAYLEENGNYEANGRSFSCYNHNAFLNMMEGALSGKTGFTGNAGYCYVGSLRQGDKTFVVALLACGWPNNKNYKWSDTKKLMEYGIANYEYRSFSEAKVDEESLSDLVVEDGKTERIGDTAKLKVTVVTKEETELAGILMKENEEIEVVCEREEILSAPVKAGTKIGTVSYLVGDKTYLTDQLIVTETVEAVDFSWCLLQVMRYYSIRF